MPGIVEIFICFILYSLGIISGVILIAYIEAKKELAEEEAEEERELLKRIEEKNWR